jgi:hypothetical protein
MVVDEGVIRGEAEEQREEVIKEKKVSHASKWAPKRSN